jgi:CHAT domain
MADQPAGEVPSQHPTTMSDDDFVPISAGLGPTSTAVPAAVPPQLPAAVSGGPVSTESPADLVTIGTDKQKEPLISFASIKLRRVASVWSQIVRNWDRWSKVGSPDGEMDALNREVLQSLGVEEKQWPDLAAKLVEASVVEVSIPHAADDQNWEARVFPWEVFLTVATKRLRGASNLFVIRHLKMPKDANPVVTSDALLYVESAPDTLRKTWYFDREREQVKANLKGYAFNEVIDPTREKLESRVVEVQPALIHITGLDNWQGAAYLNLPTSADRRDGFMLAKPQNKVDEVNADDLGSLLTQGTHRPRLVAFNCYNSGARLAASAVAKGADAAIGFQDVIEDDLAEAFFSFFYRDLAQSGKSVVSAFLRAQKDLKSVATKMTGSGIVLWRRESINAVPIPPEDLRDATPVAKDSAPPQAVTPVEVAAVEFEGGGPLGSGGGPLGSGGGGGGVLIAGGGTGNDDLHFDDISPTKQLNYSMLHNDRGVFDRFALRTAPTATRNVEGVSVTVELLVGSQGACSWDGIVKVPVGPALLLHDKIRIPLISELQRGLKSSVRTNLKVKIIQHGNSVYYESFPVELLAIDEWRDDENGREWLPSFVLPGDPIVTRVIDTAQRYLTALVDRGDAGFDAYQRIDLGATPNDVVDPQVQAIWSSLWQDHPLRYINQPPTYTEASQRLRSPTEVVTGHRGTCIDLALLLAACLEYIDVFPVIFLLDGHALGGYWRDPEAHKNFCRGLYPDDPVGTAKPSAGLSPAKGTPHPWCFNKDDYPRIRTWFDVGALVAVEATALTDPKGGFRNAVAKGGDKIREFGKFQFMMDVRQARLHNVTPLPIFSGDRR